MNYDYSRAAAIADKQTLDLLSDPMDTSVLFDESIVYKFLNQYQQWIKESKLNQLHGLEQYPHLAFSAGTSESFDKFYLANHRRRFRCWRGDYVYHRIAWQNNYDWTWLDDDEIHNNDAVIVSLPFADTGNVHKNYHNVLSTCEKLGVPVLVDCCYFGTCANIGFDLSYSCITDVAFSLSKSFPLARARVGMRLSRYDTDDTLSAYNKPGLEYTNRLSASLGIRFLEEFSPDYIYKKYHTQQLKFCKLTNTIPSNTVMFGIGDKKWNSLNRGTKTNRLSFHRYLGDYE